MPGVKPAFAGPQETKAHETRREWVDEPTRVRQIRLERIWTAEGLAPERAARRGEAQDEPNNPTLSAR